MHYRQTPVPARANPAALYICLLDPLTVSQGDVYSYMRKNGGSMREEVVVPMILQPFLSGLDAIHRRGLIHRDIKASSGLIALRSQQI